jgi:histidine kinase-like protein
MCHEDFWNLPCRVESVPIGRSRVVERMAEWGITPDDVAEPQLHAVALVATELLTNAITFCRGEIQVKVTAHHDRIEVAVTDDNPELAQIQDPGPWSLGGRGLQLVEALSHRWGQQRGDGDKTVWAQVTIPPGSKVAQGCALLDRR